MVCLEFSFLLSFYSYFKFSHGVLKVTMNQRAGFSFANILKEIIGHFSSSRNSTWGGKNKPLPASVNTRSKKYWISIIAFHLTSTKLYYLWEELFVNFLEHSYLCIHLLLRSIRYLINTAWIPLCLRLHDAPCLDLKTVMVLFKYRLWGTVPWEHVHWDPKPGEAVAHHQDPLSPLDAETCGFSKAAPVQFHGSPWAAPKRWFRTSPSMGDSLQITAYVLLQILNVINQLVTKKNFQWVMFSWQHVLTITV